MKSHNMFNKLKFAVSQKDFLISLRQISFYSGGSISAQVIMMIYAIIVARTLGPEQLGIYNGMYAILGVSITLVNFGLDQWMLKEAHNYNSVQLISGKILSIKFALGLIWGLLCVILLPITRPHHFSFFLVLLGVCDVLSDVIFNSIVSSWTIKRNIKNINTMLLVSRIGKFVLLILLIFLNIAFPITLVGSRFLISFLVVISSLFMLKPLLYGQIFTDLVSIVKKSTVFGLSEIFATIYANIDVAILTFFSITDTGIYSPASGIIHALFIIPNSIFLYLLPNYAKKVDEQKQCLFNNLAIKIIAIFGITGFALFLGLLLSGEFLVLFLLGARFAATSQVIKILSPIMLFKSISFGLALIIIITGNQRKRLLPQLIVSLINIVCNLVLIPSFGLIAVAWVYTLSEFCLMLGYLLMVKKIKNHENKQIL